MKKAAIITGIISTVMIVLGSLFKIQHWPGAGLLIVFGVMIHVLAFLPLWMIFRIKETQGGAGKAAVITGFLVLFIFYIGLLFKVQHWPGAGPFFVLAVLLAVLAFFPLILINLKKERERPLWFLPTLFIAAPVVMLLLAKNISRATVDSYRVVSRSLNDVPAQLVKSSNIFYTKLQALYAMNPEAARSYHEKASLLRKSSDNLALYIRSVRANLISNAEHIPYEIADTLPVYYISTLDNYDIPTWSMIGSDPANPNTGQYSATELKMKIDSYRKSVIDLLGDTAANKLKHLGPQTNDVYLYNYGWAETWETANFYALPLGGVLNVLEGLEVEVRNTELAVVNALTLQAADQLPVTIK